MYTIDAYDVDAWTSLTGTEEEREAALRTAQRLAKKWPIVEVRNPNPINPDNHPIAAWMHGERQF